MEGLEKGDEQKISAQLSPACFDDLERMASYVRSADAQELAALQIWLSETVVTVRRFLGEEESAKVDARGILRLLARYSPDILEQSTLELKETLVEGHRATGVLILRDYDRVVAEFPVEGLFHWGSDGWRVNGYMLFATIGAILDGSAPAKQKLQVPASNKRTPDPTSSTTSQDPLRCSPNDLSSPCWGLFPAYSPASEEVAVWRREESRTEGSEHYFIEVLFFNRYGAMLRRIVLRNVDSNGKDTLTEAERRARIALVNQRLADRGEFASLSRGYRNDRGDLASVDGAASLGNLTLGTLGPAIRITDEGGNVRLFHTLKQKNLPSACCEMEKPDHVGACVMTYSLNELYVGDGFLVIKESLQSPSEFCSRDAEYSVRQLKN